MKVALLQDQLRVGGTERQTLFLAQTFHAQGIEVELVVFKPGGHLRDDQALAGVPLHILQKSDLGPPLFAPGLIRTLRRIQPDIILCMGRSANCYGGWIQKRIPEVPVIATLRTGKSIFPLHHWSLYQVQGILVNSNWWQRRLLERDFPPERIHVVHNSIAMEHHSREREGTREALRDRMGVTDDVPVLLNVATFRRGKRHRDLIQHAFDLHQRAPERPWQLWMVGDGPEYKPSLKLVKKLGLSKRIHFFHYQADPYPYYAAADIAVSCSQEDSLPNFLIESQVMGLPLVAVDCRGVIECCQPGESGIVLPPHDRNAFLDALERLMTKAEERAVFSAKAIPFARKRFSPQTQATKTLQFLRRFYSHESL